MYGFANEKNKLDQNRDYKRVAEIHFEAGWLLARPLIEAWMMEQLGPEARLRETVDTLAGAFERLPAILDRVEQSSALIAGGRVKLHPETVAALKGERAASAFTPLSLGLLVLIAVLLVVLLA
jgi:ubiquinone biosynthesis protein